MTPAGLFTSGESGAIRAQFPCVSRHTFLNAASLTPLPAVSRDAMTAVLAQMSETAYQNLSEWKATAASARQTAARLIGASSREIAFVRNTSDGVSLVAAGLEWRPGDEVIINDLEFPSNVYPWLNLERRGVVVKTVKSEGGKVTPDAIAEAVTQKTRVVAVSTVQFSTGYRMDIAALGAMARERGFLFFVDAIQSLGAIPMNVKEAGIDFLSSGGFKWLCGPVGSGVFFCDERRLDDLLLTRVGWNTVRGSEDFATIDFTLKDDAQRFEEGSNNVAGVYGLYESMKLLMGWGVDRIEGHILALAGRLAEGLRSKGHTILSPWGKGERSGIVIFAPRDGLDIDGLVKSLTDEHIMIIRRGDGVRVSPHLYNTPEDIDRLLDAL